MTLKNFCRLIIVVLAVYGAYKVVINVIEYLENLGKAPGQVEACTDNPSLDKCLASNESLKKATKNGIEIENGVKKLNPKPE